MFRFKISKRVIFKKIQVTEQLNLCRHVFIYDTTDIDKL